ncbi:MAG: tRNA (adenosine(37)-N6)-dimethylallyltransferase MiaA [Planctomycetales bacterium]|nr:tRNA (adenosine(37)-N6)-dimethylallyltransferase MiaA [Planctomycetales bacterium]
MTRANDNLSEIGQSKDDFQRWVHPPLRNCWFLTGPTSSGKTPLAIMIAQRMDAEIISLDSMAIYQGMDIGTAKPNLDQQAQAKHHLIDIVAPTEMYSVSNYVIRAHRVAEQIRQAGKRVLVCGGTPLYLKSLVRGLFLGPEADWEFRNSVEEDVKRYGQELLRERLLQVDPLLGHKLHLHDQRRMIRALEVAKITGLPLSHWQQQFETPASRTEFPVAVLQLSRSWLHERINKRVESMIDRGLAAEIEGLLQQYGSLGRTAAQAVGYREMLQHLQGKATSMAETTELIKAHTRQFARRQEIWFRGLKELVGIPVTPSCNLESIADRICDLFNNPAD